MTRQWVDVHDCARGRLCPRPILSITCRRLLSMRSMVEAASPCPSGSRSHLIPSDASPLQSPPTSPRPPRTPYEQQSGSRLLHPPTTLAFLPTSRSMSPLSVSQIRKTNARINAGATRKRSTLPLADVSVPQKK